MLSFMHTEDSYGMKTMNQSLAQLYLSHKITIGDAMGRSSNSQELNEILSKKQEVSNFA